MGTRYTTTPAVAFNSSPPPDDGTQVASNLVTYAGVKTKLADPVHVQADAIDSKLVAALDLSARAISSPDTAIASDHWKTLQVTGSTTITLSSAASMGAGYEVGIFNAGVGVVTVTPGNAADTINGVSASVTIPIKGTIIFRTNQGLTGYNVVGQSNRMDAGTVNGATVGATTPASGAFTTLTATISAQWGTGTANFGTIIKRKTADESVTSSTVLQDDDHLTFAIAANEEWKGFIDYTFGDLISTTGIKAAMTFPSGATIKYHAVSIGAGAGNAQALFATTSGATLDFTAAGYAGSGNASLRMSFWVLNGATPGNVTAQFAQSTSSGTALKAYKGSWLDATRVA